MATARTSAYIAWQMGMSKGKNFHQHLIRLDLMDPSDYSDKDNAETAKEAKKRAKRIKWFDKERKRKNK